MIDRVKHTVINISIVEFEPQSRPTDRPVMHDTAARQRSEATERSLNQDTKFTVRADTTDAAIKKAIKRLAAFSDEDDNE